MTGQCCVAAGQALDDLEADEDATDELARDILQWAAQGLYIYLSSNNSQASFNKTIDWWKSCRHVQETFRQALPDSYKKVLGFLEAQHGTVSYLYDRCALTDVFSSYTAMASGGGRGGGGLPPIY